MFCSFLHIQLCLQPSLKIIVLISAPFYVSSINISQETVAFFLLFSFWTLCLHSRRHFLRTFHLHSNHVSPLYTNHFNKSTHTQLLTCLNWHGFYTTHEQWMKYSDKLASTVMGWLPQLCGVFLPGIYQEQLENMILYIHIFPQCSPSKPFPSYLNINVSCIDLPCSCSKLLCAHRFKNGNVHICSKVWKLQYCFFSSGQCVLTSQLPCKQG